MPVTDMNIAYKREHFLSLKGFAGVLDSRFSENELFINKISNRKNTAFLLDRPTVVDYIGDTSWYDGMNFKKKQLLLKRKFTVGQSVFLWINTITRLVFDGSMIALMFLSPLRYWIAGIWLFKIVHELIWGIIAMKRLGEKNLLPGLLFLRSLAPLFNSILTLKQLFTRRKRKWK